MTEEPTPTAPDAPDDNPTEVIMLEDVYSKAFIGHTVSASEHPRAIYSLTRLVKTEQRIKDMPEDSARMSIVSLIYGVTNDHGERAPIFVDDAVSQPRKPEKGKIIRPGGW